MLVLCGQTASGKDTIKKELLEMGMKSLVTYTTRPMRPGEVEGVNYHYLSKEEFLKKVEEGFFAEYASYDVATGETWYYGSAKEDISDDKVVILNPKGVKALREAGGLDLYVFLIHTEYNVLIERLKARGDKKEEYLRRLKEDLPDFEELRYDVFINNDGSLAPRELAEKIFDIYEKR